MREIKSTYPRNRIHIAFEGDDAFLSHPNIESLRRYPGKAEVTLRSSATLADDAQSLLALAMQHAHINRFEVTQPTLEEIFIEKVQEKSPEQFDLDLPLPQLEVPEGSYQGA